MIKVDGEINIALLKWIVNAGGIAGNKIHIPLGYLSEAHVVKGDTVRKFPSHFYVPDFGKAVERKRRPACAARICSAARSNEHNCK